MRTLPLLLLAALPLLGVGRADAAPATAADPARLVAARVQSFYAQTRTTRVDFAQSFYHRAYQRYDRSRGELVVAKPGRMRFDYAAPNARLVIVDGSRVGLREADGEGGPATWQTARLAAEPAAFGFLSGTADLGRDYDFRLLDASAYRFDGHVLELRPKRHDPRYRRVLLFVDADPRRAGVVHRVRIDDHEGNVNRFFLRRPRFDRPVPASLFSMPD